MSEFEIDDKESKVVERRETLYKVNKECVDFLYSLNYGNGFAPVFAIFPRTFIDPRGRVINYIDTLNSYINIHLDGETQADEIMEIFEKDRDFYTENYEKNVIYLGSKKRVVPEIHIDRSLISVKNNCKLLFENEISSLAFLLRLFYLFLILNNLTVYPEKNRNSSSEYEDPPYVKISEINFEGYDYVREIFEKYSNKGRLEIKKVISVIHKFILYAIDPDEVTISDYEFEKEYLARVIDAAKGQKNYLKKATKYI